MAVKVTGVLVLLATMSIENGHFMPQGFLPKLASWNKNEGLTLLPAVKVDSPVRNSFINVFSKNNKTSESKHKADTKAFTAPGSEPSDEEKSIPKKHTDITKITNLEPYVTNKVEDDSENMTTSTTRPEDFSKEFIQEMNKRFFELINDVTDNQLDETDNTTETTTVDYETTTEYEILNRANPQLVASLLG